MSDLNNQHPPQEEEAAPPQFSVKGIYLRNISLETSTSPILLRSGIQPEMKLELRVQINSAENYDEVLLDLNITARDNNNLLYLIKMQQAGCFVLNNFTVEQKDFFLNTTCASLIYPYASQMANTLSVQSGFPPVNIMPIDFAHLYSQQQASQAQVKASSLEGQKPVNSGTLNPMPQANKSTSKWADLVTSQETIEEEEVK